MSYKPTPTKPFKCTMCAMEYTIKGFLAAHVKKKYTTLNVTSSQSTSAQIPAVNSILEPTENSTSENTTPLITAPAEIEQTIDDNILK